jgi:hypothetical protein
VSRLPGRVPFSSTLRPSLSGALPRTAGGYSLGGGRIGGARYFSHGPAAPAQVLNNVSASVRAFWLSGQKAQFDGCNTRTGEKRYRAVTALQEQTGRKLQAMSKRAPGSFIDFKTNPTITAFSPLAGLTTKEADPEHLNTDGLLDVLSVDFARSLKELAITLGDLKSLSALGDLPMSHPGEGVIRVHFPGCDANIVDRLCDELGIRRGIVQQDEDFDAFTGAQMALLFPFAPSDTPSSKAPSVSSRRHRAHKYAKRDEVNWQDMVSPSSGTSSSYPSARSDDGFVDIPDSGSEIEPNPWVHPDDLSGYESDDAPAYFEPQTSRNHVPISGANSSSEYEGLEGIYRFLEECDGLRR